jgi:hypothetical protein
MYMLCIMNWWDIGIKINTYDIKGVNDNKKNSHQVLRQMKNNLFFLITITCYIMFL